MRKKKYKKYNISIINISIINISIINYQSWITEKRKNKNRKKTMKNSKQNNLKIALLQLLPEKTREENLKKGINACIEAKKKRRGYSSLPGTLGYRLLNSAGQNRIERKSDIGKRTVCSSFSTNREKTQYGDSHNFFRKTYSISEKYSMRLRQTRKPNFKIFQGSHL